MTKRLLYRIRRPIALLVALVMALAPMLVATPTALAADITRTNPVAKISDATSSAGWTDAQITLDSAGTGGTEIMVSADLSVGFKSVGNITTVPIVASSSTATIPWYANGGDPANMIGFNVTVPDTHTWLTNAKLTTKDALGTPYASDTQVTKIAGVTNTDTRTNINYTFADNIPGEVDFTKGGIIHLYARPNEARIYEYTLTWADDQSATSTFEETIIIDMTAATLKLADPTPPVPPTNGKAASGTDVELKLDLNTTATANSAVVGTWDGYAQSADVAYEVYVMTGASSDLTFKLINATGTSLPVPVNTAYQVATGTSLATVAEGPKGDVKITGLNDRDVILFYTDADNYIKVRVVQVAKATVTVSGTETGDLVSVEYTDTLNANNAKTVDTFPSSELLDIANSTGHLGDNVKITVTTGTDRKATVKLNDGEALTPDGGSGNVYTTTLTEAKLYAFTVTFEADPGSGTSTPVTSEADLAEALIDKTDITVTESFELTNDSTKIPAGTTLTIASGKTLTIPVGKTLSIYGSLALESGAKVSIAGALEFGYNADITPSSGTLELNGGVIRFVPDQDTVMLMALSGTDITTEVKDVLANLTATLEGGTVEIRADQGVEFADAVIVPSNVTLDVDGELIVTTGGSLTLSTDAALVLNNGATSDIKGALVIGGTINIGNGVMVDLSGATVTSNNGTIVLAPGARLKPDTLDSITVKDFAGNTLIMDSNGNYTVADYAIDITSADGGLGVSFKIEVSEGVTSGDLYLIVQSTEGGAVSLAMIAVGAYNATSGYETYVSYSDADQVDVWLVYEEILSGMPNWTAPTTGMYLQTETWTVTP